MIKDRQQKQKVLRYALARRWFPQLELQVSSHLTIGESPLQITDVDVFASVPDEQFGYSRFLADCRTRRRESPINRALWLRGLMERLDATRGMCLLRAGRIEADHRYTAAQLGITILGENEFDSYARATSRHYDEDQGILGELDAWDLFFSIGSSFPQLQPGVSHSASGYWMAQDPSHACRRTLYLLQKLRPELDPAKPAHVALSGELVALFTHSLAILVNRIFAEYLQPADPDDLSAALLFLLYGGRESYDDRNRLHKLIRKTQGREVTDEDRLSLPQWHRFVEFVRQLLDSPLEATSVPLLIREAAWSHLVDTQELTLNRSLGRTQKQSARFAVLAVEYCFQAAGLPPEFREVLADQLLRVQVE